MHKNEAYERLAQVYLDPANKKRKSPLHKKSIFKYLFVFSLVVITGLIFSLSSNFIGRGRSVAKKDVALIIQPGLTQINFDFNLAKKGILNFDLSGLDLQDYKTLGFFARKAGAEGNLYLRLQLSNSFGEQSEVYLKDISIQWSDFKIDLRDFKNITGWSSMSDLQFVIEEWNTEEKRGKIYIDDICFLK